MFEIVQKLLEKTNYIPIIREEEFTNTLLPLLYFAETKLVLYNKIGIVIEDNTQVTSNLTDDDFEYVLKGTIVNKLKNLEFNVTEVKKYVNKRKSKRYDVNKPTEIIKDDNVITAKIINLSQSGALITIEQELEIDSQLLLKVYDDFYSSKVMRVDNKTGSVLYGVQFDNTIDIMKVLRSYNVNTYKSDKNIFVLLDTFENLEHYGKVFENDVNLNFVNVMNNFDSFIVDYIENDKKDIIILDMKEQNLTKYAEQLKTYINVQKVLLVLIDEDAPDEIVNYLMENSIPMLFKAFLESELSRLLLKMS